ncbi:MAG TPA: LuxR C-terminal-related transcriptional regulator, partial [Minicystis sp.]|nr:LuxR C-terminal-related transcriptional regulator [Minicystis sp.]
MRDLDELLSRVAVARSERELAGVLMDRLQAMFDAVAAGFYTLDGAGRAVDVHIRTELPERDLQAVLDEYERSWRAIDPVLRAAIEQHAPAHNLSVMSRERWTSTEPYRVMRNWGVEHYLLAPVYVGGKLAGTLQFSRLSRASPFAAADVQRAAAAAMHVSSRLSVLRFAELALEGWRSTLTQRELEVAELVVKGLSNEEIARVLGLSVDAL